jgi:hypothetical protein
MWWRIGHRPRPTIPQVPQQARSTKPADDRELAAWQQYLADLRTVDPPGGPPAR